MRMNTRINSELVTRSNRRNGTVSRHKLPACPTTGLPRYRDRHQARQGARAMLKGSRNYETSTFACPNCRGYHLEKIYRHEPIEVSPAQAPSAQFLDSLGSRKRRYFLVDIENATRGAKATPTQVAQLWDIIMKQAPGIAPHDHVVVGAARMVVRNYRAAIHAPNVKWVVGADAPDGADHALLSAIDLRRVARDYDELVIFSGDHAFADLARRAEQAGLSVQVITTEHPEQSTVLSRELASVADTHTVIRLKPRSQKPTKVTPITKHTHRTRRHAQQLPAAA